MNACNKEFSPLYHAVFYQRETSVRMLLEEGASIKQPKNLLHIAARNGGKGVLRLLLSDNRCTEDVINELDDVGRTAAYIAAQQEHKDCLKMLIAEGADLSRTLLGDETVMDVIFERITSPVEFLLEILNSTIGMVQIEGQRNRYFFGKLKKLIDFYSNNILTNFINLNNIILFVIFSIQRHNKFRF